MAVPKKKISKSRRGKRRSHLALDKTCLAIDSVTGDHKRPHHINLKDGTYKGKKIIKIKGLDNVNKDE